MKRLFYLLLVGTMLTSCDVVVTDNGKLDGYWQLQQLDTLQTGGSTDMRESNIYWAVGFDLLEVCYTPDRHASVFFRFKLDDDQLTISNPYFDNREVGDIVVTDATDLHRFGLYRLREEFAVEQLSSSRMTLRSDRFRFFFRKY